MYHFQAKNPSLVGPYKMEGFYAFPSKSLAEHNPLAYNMQLRMAPKNWALGICDVCGTCLTNNILMTDANGKRFVVGTDCMMRSGEEALTMAARMALRGHEANQRAAKKAAATRARLAAERLRNNGLTDEEVREAKRNAERLLKVEACMALFGMLVEAAEATGNSIALDITKRMRHSGWVSDKQVKLLQDIVEVANRFSLDEYFGEVGQRVDLDLVVVKAMLIEGYYGTKELVIMQDLEGRTFKFCGTSKLFWPERIVAGAKAYELVKAGDTLKLKATIKEHAEYKGTKQTVIARPAGR